MGFTGVPSRATGLFWNVWSIKGGGVFVYTKQQFTVGQGEPFVARWSE